MTVSHLVLSATADCLGRLGDVSVTEPAARRLVGPFPTLAALLQACLDGFATAPDRGEEIAGRLLSGAPAQEVFRRADGGLLVVSGEPLSGDSVRVRVFDHPAPEGLRSPDVDLLQDIIDAVPATISIKDHLRRYLFVNRAWEQHYGISRSDVVGRHFESLVPGDVSTATFGSHSGDVRNRDTAVLENGTPLFGDEEHFVDGSGRPRTLLSSKLPLFNGDGRPWAVLSVTHDISVLKETEAALRRAKTEAEAANHAKSEFLAIVGHELRTPLNAILGFAELGGMTPPSSRTIGYFSLIGRAGKTLSHVIADILDMSQIELGRFQLDEAPVDPRDVIHETVDLMQPDIEARGLMLRVCVADDVPPRLQADGKRLRQILLNLLSNAAKFTASGSISVDSRVERGNGGEPGGRACLRIDVTDTGIGIPHDRQAEIFDAFTQLETQNNRRHQGLGLGLSICKRLLAHMKGEIGVESTPGEGSRFWLRLPLRMPEEPCRPANDSRKMECLPLRKHPPMARG